MRTLKSEKILKQGAALIAASAMIAGIFGGCSNSGDTNNNVQSTPVSAEPEQTENTPSVQAEPDGNEDEVTVVQFAAFTSYVPYCYLDDDGNPVGYEYDVIAAVDELLPQYEFEINADGDFANLLLGLDSGKYQVVGCQMEYTEERAEKYLFPQESNDTYITYIVVAADNDEIQTWEDLAGKKVQTGDETGSGYSLFSAYNEQNPDYAVDIVTGAQTSDEIITGILNGAWVASAYPINDIDRLNRNYGVDGKDAIRIVEPDRPLNVTHGYFLFSKENKELQEAYDEAMRTLKENGTLKELAEKWLEGDYSSPLGE